MYIKIDALYFFLAVKLGSGTFGTCHTMWFSGLTVAVKIYHHKNIKKKHIQMEAKMLQVNCSYINVYTVYQPSLPACSLYASRQ